METLNKPKCKPIKAKQNKKLYFSNRNQITSNDVFDHSENTDS